MDNLEFRQITQIDSENLDIMTKWMYNWWGKEEGYTFEGVKCYMEHTFQKDRLPKTYGLFDNGRIIGMFQFIYEDLEIRPDIYPWLANLYVDEEYRNKGMARILIQKVNEVAKTTLEFKELYLYTKQPRIQRLYKLDIKD